jgi:hypothetical protein
MSLAGVAIIPVTLRESEESISRADYDYNFFSVAALASFFGGAATLQGCWRGTNSPETARLTRSDISFFRISRIITDKHHHLTNSKVSFDPKKSLSP